METLDYLGLALSQLLQFFSDVFHLLLLPGLDECHFFLGVIELIEPGLDIFLLPNFFWGEFFSAMIAEKPHTQPDLSGENPTLWHSWFPPFQA